MLANLYLGKLATTVTTRAELKSNQISVCNVLEFSYHDVRWNILILSQVS